MNPWIFQPYPISQEAAEQAAQEAQALAAFAQQRAVESGTPGSPSHGDGGLPCVKPPGKLWENYGKIWENTWKLWESYGKESGKNNYTETVGQIQGKYGMIDGKCMG